MNKHTPGPWQQHDPKYAPNEIVGNLEGPMEDGRIHGIEVCEVADTPSPEETAANIRLIVAAPEMFALCEYALKILMPMIAMASPAYNMQPEPVTQDDEKLDDLCRHLTLLIRDVKGETP